ncbi:MAG: type II secretion system minor pseudopilin GspK [Deltaproteobacteria bacterium]|nr:type II secretion system minor pseudopilin GspK [Deltaproteobacteria bacterium]
MMLLNTIVAGCSFLVTCLKQPATSDQQRVTSNRNGLNQRGMALILALLVVAILTTAILDFTIGSRVNLTLAGHAASYCQAMAAAQSGVNFALVALQEETAKYISLDQHWANFSQYTGMSEKLFIQGRFTGNIFDLNARININKLAANTPDPTTLGQLERLFDVLGLERQLIDGILDYVTPGDTPRPYGAKNSYYRSLDPPYSCKNAPLDDLSELLLVKGMTREIYYGRKEKNGQKIVPGLSEFLTVKSDGLINVNTAPEEVLAALFKPPDISLARTIIAHRRETPLKITQDLLQVPGVKEAGLPSNTTCTSHFFSIRITGFSGEASCDIATNVNLSNNQVGLLTWRVF